MPTRGTAPSLAVTWEAGQQVVGLFHALELDPLLAASLQLASSNYVDVTVH